MLEGYGAGKIGKETVRYLNFWILKDAFILFSFFEISIQIFIYLFVSPFSLLDYPELQLSSSYLWELLEIYFLVWTGQDI